MKKEYKKSISLSNGRDTKISSNGKIFYSLCACASIDMALLFSDVIYFGLPIII